MSFAQPTRGHWIFLLACLSVVNADAQIGTADLRLQRFQQQRLELDDRFFTQLDPLIEFSDARKLTEAGAELRRWQRPVDGEALLGRPLPRDVQPELSRDLSEEERQWRVPLRSARENLAKELYLLARRILNANYPSAAWGLLREVVYFDPDHEKARGLLGFERFNNQWTTPFAARMLKRGFVWHDRYGWLPENHVARYEAGERNYRTQWISAEREEAIRRDFRNAWEVETDHFRVKTNVSLERGVELAKLLEDFHKYFHAQFAAFFESPEQLRKKFEGVTTKSAKVQRPFEVHFFRTRDEYVNRLKKDNPQIAITNGIYIPDDRVAYFFDNPDIDVQSTLYHEATHQILYELHTQPRAIAEREHFWIVEGIACYMESFRPGETGFRIGDPEYIRFKAARYRALEERYYVPLGRFAAMGKLAFQTDQHIEKNYSQASGLAHFFMHYGNGRYRDALVQHLESLYRPQPPRMRVPGLDQLLGVAHEELDQQYMDYLTAMKHDQ